MGMDMDLKCIERDGMNRMYERERKKKREREMEMEGKKEKFFDLTRVYD